jgi:proteic killer suppression protein
VYDVGKRAASTAPPGGGLLVDVHRITVYSEVVIRSFHCADSERLFRRETVRRFKAIERQALRKLDMLDAAPDIRTLAALPGNRLESLKGDRKGQFSIRINEQWRICFVSLQGHAYDVEIVDYH